MGPENQNSNAEERKDPQVLDQSEFESMIRGETTERPETQVVDKGRSARQDGEPEIVVAEEKKTGKKDEQKGEATPLDKALATIEELRQNQSKLETEMTSLRSSRTSETTRREAEVELEEFVPGIRVPKDRSKWPVKLSKELVEKAGLNGDLTQPLEILGNLLYWDMARLVNEMVGNTVETKLRGRQDNSERESSFLDEHPDLKDQSDFVAFTEGKLRKENRHLNINDTDYRKLVATETRRTLAKARGISYDDYMSGIERKQEPVTRQGDKPRQSRVISTGTGRRGPGETGASAFDREAGDLMRR